jgi:hypothetical protein
VYYQPSSVYNLISWSQLEDDGFDVMFRQRQIMGQDQAIGLTRTGNIYSIQEVDHDTKGYIFHQDTAFSGTHVGKMRTDELCHRCLMHMSYGKLKCTTLWIWQVCHPSKYMIIHVTHMSKCETLEVIGTVQWLLLYVNQDLYSYFYTKPRMRFRQCGLNA